MGQWTIQEFCGCPTFTRRPYMKDYSILINILKMTFGLISLATRVAPCFHGSWFYINTMQLWIVYSFRSVVYIITNMSARARLLLKIHLVQSKRHFENCCIKANLMYVFFLIVTTLCCMVYNLILHTKNVGIDVLMHQLEQEA